MQKYNSIVIRNNLNPIVVTVTDVNAATRTDCYATRCRELSIGRAFGPKGMHEDTVFTVNRYSIVLTFGNKNDTKHINSEATWSIQLTSAGALCTNSVM